MKRLEGPRLGLDASDGPTHLVVLLHGYGTDGSNMLQVAKLLYDIMPFAAFHAPTAPFACRDVEGGFEWFDSSLNGDDVAAAGVRKAAPYVDAFLDEMMTLYKLDESKIALFGFSQGAIVALHVGLRRRRTLGGIVSIASMLAAPETLSAEIQSRPPVLLLHGDADELMPPDNAHRAAEVLRLNGVDVDLLLSPGVRHEIGTPAFSRAWRFLYNVAELPVPGDG
jgi:phospholipase/carboxylesterase